VTLNFSGPFVALLYVVQSNTGIATITIDGAVVDHLDTYSANRMFKQIRAFTNTARGTHTVVITVSGNKNPASGGTFIIFDAFTAQAAAS
jgi:hypothetical protein